MSTLPEFRSVAVWYSRVLVIDPVAVNVETPSNSSARDR
jgi:hypothetical protein